MALELRNGYWIPVSFVRCRQDDMREVHHVRLSGYLGKG